MRIAVMKKLIADLQLQKLKEFIEVSKSAEGIVEKATTFTGIVRAQFITILLVNKANEPIPNLKCKVEFKDGQTTQVKSDSEGILKALKKTKGEIKLQEEEQPSTESTSSE
jgi:hypothetical protein